MDSEKIDYLIINRKHFSTCQASRILVGFSDVLLREPPITLGLNGESAARPRV